MRRSSDGLPFASPNGLYNLSRLSVWWLRLGIAIERIKRGHPQTIDNPFGTRLSPMSWVRSVTHVSGPDKLSIGGR